jgi:hypothetical protein
MLSALTPITALTQDHAGKPVPLVRFNFSYLPIAPGPLPADVQRAMRTALMRETSTLRNYLSLRFWLWAIGFAAAMPLAMLAIWFIVTNAGLYQSLGPLVFVMPLIAFAPITVLTYILAPLGLSDRMRTIAAATAAQHGYCGSCGYTLPASQNTSSPLAMCTECGACWTASSPPPRG